MSEKSFKVSCCESSARKESFKNLSKSSSNGTNRQSVKKSFKKHNLAIIDFNAAVKLKTTSRFRNSGFKSLNQHYVPFGLSESSPSSIGHEYGGTNVKKI